MVKKGLYLYVEGGGDHARLTAELGRAFHIFFKKAKLPCQPRVFLSGSRKSAYDDFCQAVQQGQAAMLLVDSEGPVANRHQQGPPEAWQPWRHLKERNQDQWERPSGAEDLDCHLMVQFMESWFLADREAMRDYFGQGFNVKQLPAAAKSVEDIAKEKVDDALQRATRECKPKNSYEKGRDSFKLLARIDPNKVVAASGWAKRLVDTLKRRMAASDPA
ncbi:MAG: DUF4276 family protein [Magnetococcales bacterium]|nr:DUF4276 family protein [Magnetococcales bacterium]